MSGQTFETRVRIPDPGKQAEAQARSVAQRLGEGTSVTGSTLLAGTGISATSRIGRLVAASASVATVVSGSVLHDGRTTAIEMRARGVRFAVQIEEVGPDEESVIARTVFTDSHGATCAEEVEITTALVAAWAQDGLRPVHPDAASATAPGIEAPPIRRETA